ncbi:MAG: tetratricopeptide repeat protein [Nitrospinae bacterium]|nr:tetratricopeptide repeat protein [Nitrospinota bacterium]
MSIIRRLSNPGARIKALEGRLQQYPSSAAFFPLASLFWEKGEADQAENLLKSGLSTYPNYAAAGVLLGEILISKDDHEQAARFIAKALEIAPWNISGQRLLAECYQKEGDGEAEQIALKAANMFEADKAVSQDVVADTNVDKASVVDPEDELGEVVTPALAELYLAQGHLDNARDVYERLLESDPANIQWNERLAAIRKELSQHEDVDTPTGYPGTEENLDLVADEVIGEPDVRDEATTDAVTPEQMEPVEVGAETSSAEFEGSGEDLTLTNTESEYDKERRECSVSPAEDVVREKFVDSILQKLIECYIQEKNELLALDMCRKAQDLGVNASWVMIKISELERKVEESAVSLLRNDAEEDKDRTTQVLPLADQRVVDTLEDWLETLQRRKTST